MKSLRRRRSTREASPRPHRDPKRKNKNGGRSAAANLPALPRATYAFTATRNGGVAVAAGIAGTVAPFASD